MLEPKLELCEVGITPTLWLHGLLCALDLRRAIGRGRLPTVARALSPRLGSLAIYSC